MTTDAQVLAALEVLGWPDDREASAHIEPDGHEVTPARHYWDLVTSVLDAAAAAYVSSLLPDGMTEAELIERFRQAMAQPQRIEVLLDDHDRFAGELLGTPEARRAYWEAAHARGVAEGVKRAVQQLTDRAERQEAIAAAAGVASAHAAGLRTAADILAEQDGDGR